MTDDLQTRIDTYLMKLRRSLGELPPDDVNDILREIRSHILDRAEGGGELTNEKLALILRELGQPEEIGPLYSSEASVARARSSLSPLLILRATMRWGMNSLLGFAVFVAGLLGYGLAVGLILSAIVKPFDPEHVGAWLTDSGFTIGTLAHPTHPDLLGWWIIPVGLIVGAILLVATTRSLRWMLRFAIRRHAVRSVGVASAA
jgi:uncharacterized membrane protein